MVVAKSGSTSCVRASELASLTARDLDLLGEPPTITLQAAYSKRHRTDTQPLRGDLDALLGDWLAKARPMVQLAATMLRADLQAAGIAYEDASGQVFDFHSLRHQYISNLAAAGVHPKVAQSLAR